MFQARQQRLSKCQQNSKLQPHFYKLSTHISGLLFSFENAKKMQQHLTARLSLDLLENL